MSRAGPVGGGAPVRLRLLAEERQVQVHLAGVVALVVHLRPAGVVRTLAAPLHPQLVLLGPEQPVGGVVVAAGLALDVHPVGPGVLDLHRGRQPALHRVDVGHDVENHIRGRRHPPALLVLHGRMIYPRAHRATTVGAVPELPEVEVVRSGLERWVVGRTVAKAEMLHPRATRRHLAGPDDVVARLTGRTLTSAERRGKYLWLPLAGRAGRGPARAPRDERPAAGRAAGRRRTGRTCGPGSRSPTAAGSCATSTSARSAGCRSSRWPATAVPAVIAHIGRDPLDPAFDLAAFTAALRKRRTGIKRALLDQSLVSGIGNIYADEALWRARLHWARATDTLTRPAVATLVEAVRTVMNEALAAGGTSFDTCTSTSTARAATSSGPWTCTAGATSPAARCGTPIRRDPFMNRSSFTLPALPAPAAARAVVTVPGHGIGRCPIDGLGARARARCRVSMVGAGTGTRARAWSAGPPTWTTAGSRSWPRDPARPSRRCWMP